MENFANMQQLYAILKWVLNSPHTILSELAIHLIFEWILKCDKLLGCLNAFENLMLDARWRWWCHNLKLTVCFTICNDQINMRLDIGKCERKRIDWIVSSDPCDVNFLILNVELSNCWIRPITNVPIFKHK